MNNNLNYPGMPQGQPVPQPGMPQGQPVPQPVMPQGQPGYQPVMPQGQPVYQPIDKRIIKQCRHNAEKRWYRRLFVLNLLIIVAAIAYFIYSMNDNREYYENIVDYYASSMTKKQNETESGNSRDSGTTSDGEGEDDKSILSEVKQAPQNIQLLLAILYAVIALPFIVSYTYAQYRSMSVRITEKTYPEIYAIVQEYAQKLGMKRVPKIYMVQGNGILNAFSAFIPFRQYIELYADLLEVAYREHHDMATIRFVIAHEMAHIYYRHSKMHNYYGILFSQMIPILGATLSRAREYSCDRLAQVLSGSDGMDTMMMLIAGIHLYRQVDKNDYVQNAVNVNGFFVFCYNLVCNHPIMPKRVFALVDPYRRSGKLY